jgi:hypothetical protein
MDKFQRRAVPLIRRMPREPNAVRIVGYLALRSYGYGKRLARFWLAYSLVRAEVKAFLRMLKM